MIDCRKLRLINYQYIYENREVNMKRKLKSKLLSVVLAVTMIAGSLSAISSFDGTAPLASAAKKTSLKTKKLTITKGSSKKIVLKNKKAKRTYTFTSSKKKVATVSKKGVVKGKKVGKANITVKEKYKSGKKTKTAKIGTVKVNVVNKTQPTPTAVPVTPVPNVVTPTAVPVTGSADFYVACTGNDTNP